MTRRELPSLPPGTRGLARHPALVELSRDHHGVLVQALLLRRAAEQGQDGRTRLDTLAAHLRFHDEHVAGHMADEEAGLLPLTRGVDDQAAARIVEEHRAIETLTERLRGTTSDGPGLRADLRALGELLHDHVRFEERGFFMRVQECLSAEALDALGQALERQRRARGIAPGCALPPKT